MNPNTAILVTSAVVATMILRNGLRSARPASAASGAGEPSEEQIHNAIVGMLRQRDNTSRPEGLTRNIASSIYMACRTCNLDPALLLASGYTESRFNPSAVSSIGARGIWQQLPQYGQYYSDACWDDTTNEPRCSWSQASQRSQDIDLYVNNIPHAARIAARHFSYLITKYRSFEEGICRYAAGTRGEGCNAGREYMTKLKERMEWARTFY